MEQNQRKKKSMIFPGIVLILGIGALFYGISFQLELFQGAQWSRPYILYAVAGLVFGVVIGLFSFSFVLKRQKSDQGFSREMAFAYMLTLLVCLLLTYTSTVMILFVIGIFGSTISLTSIGYYVVTAFKDRGKDEN